jgi:hypothetical protein
MKNLKTIILSILIFIGILIIISFIVETNKCECKWSEATYWEKSTCRNCGEVKTRGELKTPSFIKNHWGQYGIIARTNQEYEYETSDSIDGENKANALVKFSDFQIITGSTDFIEKAGYEWQIITMSFTFKNTIYFNYGVYDFYDYSFDDNSGFQASDVTNNGDGESSYTVYWKNKEYNDCIIKRIDNGFDVNGKYIVTIGIRVPIGYDANVLYVQNYYNVKHNILNDKSYIFYVMRENYS